MTREEREEAIEVLNGIEEVYGALPEDGNKIDEALSMAIKALEQDPCEDAISRSAAIKAIDERAKRIKNEDTLNGLAGAVGVLFDLPPVKPQYTDDEIQAEWELVEPQERSVTNDSILCNAWRSKN